MNCKVLYLLKHVLFPSTMLSTSQSLQQRRRFSPPTCFFCRLYAAMSWNILLSKPSLWRLGYLYLINHGPHRIAVSLIPKGIPVQSRQALACISKGLSGGKAVPRSRSKYWPTFYSFLTMNPGQQLMTGSFRPIEVGEWVGEAYEHRADRNEAISEVDGRESAPDSAPSGAAALGSICRCC